MIKVTVKFYSIFCVAAGFCREEEIEMESGGALKVLVDLMVLKYGENFRRKLLDRSGNLPITAWILVNGERVDASCFGLCLKEGDVVTFTTPMLVGG